MTPRWPTLQDQPVLVLGLGASGMAMARWCAHLGARVTIADTRAHPPMATTLKVELPTITVLHTPFDAALAQHTAWTLVARSPGIAPAHMQALRETAEAHQIPVVNELELFIDGLHLGAAAPIVAVTGTNGKTTTTALAAHLLEHAGWDVAVAGNIGPNLLDVLRQRQQRLQPPQAWVLELSSFQLDGVKHFEPTAATVLNVSQDHLDWHGDMASYAQAKGGIFGATSLMVLNRQDAEVMRWAPQAARVKVGNRFRPQKRAHTTFGIDVPQESGDWGLETVNGMTWLVRAQGQDDDWVLQRLMPAEALRIRGRHNATNALAALALTTALGAPLAPMLHALRDYAGEPHRVESVSVIHDVEFVNDSKGTNVGATVAAITGLGAERDLWLIMGGEGKGQNFEPLVPAVKAHVLGVALMGRDAQDIATTLTPSGVKCHVSSTMEHAVQWCAAQARPGQVVLLSPACASFDMFTDYAHRGDMFVKVVRELALEQGSLT